MIALAVVMLFVALIGYYTVAHIYKKNERARHDEIIRYLPPKGGQ